MRPRYETSKDLSAETAAMDLFASKFGYWYKKLPISYRLDYAIMKENEKAVVGVIEVKCRKFSWSRFPDLILSLSKIMKMKQFEDVGIPAGLLLKNDDGLWLWKYARGYDDVTWGGRTISPRDDQDSEPIVHIHRSAFIKV